MVVSRAVYGHGPGVSVRWRPAQGHRGCAILHHRHRQGGHGCGYGQGTLRGLGDLDGVPVHHGRVAGLAVDLVTQVGQHLIQGLSPGHRVVVDRAIHPHGPGLPVPGRPVQGHRNGGVHHRGGGFGRRRHPGGHGQWSVHGLGDLNVAPVHTGIIAFNTVDLLGQIVNDLNERLVSCHRVLVHGAVNSDAPDITVCRSSSEDYRSGTVANRGPARRRDRGRNRKSTTGQFGNGDGVAVYTGRKIVCFIDLGCQVFQHRFQRLGAYHFVFVNLIFHRDHPHSGVVGRTVQCHQGRSGRNGGKPILTRRRDRGRHRKGTAGQFGNGDGVAIHPGRKTVCFIDLCCQIIHDLIQRLGPGRVHRSGQDPVYRDAPSARVIGCTIQSHQGRSGRNGGHRILA